MWPLFISIPFIMDAAMMLVFMYAAADAAEAIVVVVIVLRCIAYVMITFGTTTAIVFCFVLFAERFLQFGQFAW